MQKRLEIACFNVFSALIAEQSGADRIEFCKNYSLGGITPDLEDVKHLKKELKIPVFVMIRPRGGNFLYTEEELEQMKQEISAFKKVGVDGFVFGILDHKNQIDINRNKELVQLANPTPCTFHRAFDLCKNPLEALENVIKCDFKFILTSGNINSAINGIPTLNELVKKAKSKISIIVGGGVRFPNIELLKNETNADWFHSACITDNSETANSDEIQNIKKVLQDI